MVRAELLGELCLNIKEQFDVDMTKEVIGIAK